LAGHHRQRGIQCVELVLMQLIIAPLLVGLKLTPAGQIGHLRDFQNVLDDRLAIRNWHALRRRHHRQRRSRQSKDSGRALKFTGRE
jgi:hypothetical protein